MLSTIKQLKGVFNFNLYFSNEISSFVESLDKNKNTFVSWDEIKTQNEEIQKVMREIFEKEFHKDFDKRGIVYGIGVDTLSRELKNILQQQGKSLVDLMRQNEEAKTKISGNTSFEVKTLKDEVSDKNSFIFNFDVSRLQIKDSKGRLIRNDEVVKLQKYLGFKKQDGKFGPMTENALNFAKRRISIFQESKTENKISLNEVEKKETNLEKFLKGKNLNQLKSLKQNLDRNLKFYNNGNLDSSSYDKLKNILISQGYEFKSFFKKEDEIKMVLNKLEEITGIRTPGKTRESLNSKTYFDKGIIFDSVEIIGDLKMSDRKKLLKAFELNNKEGLNNKLKAAYEHILEINSRLSENEKIEAVFDFDINGNVSSENNFYIPETEVNKLLNNRPLLNGLLKEINYPKFFSDLKTNYFIARENFIDKIHKKFGKGNEKFVGFMSKSSGNYEKQYSYRKTNETISVNLVNELSGFSNSISEGISSILKEKNISGNLNKNTRIRKGALYFMNPNNSIEVRFNGLKELSKGLKDDRLKNYLNSRNFSLEEKDAIVDYLVVYARRSNQSFNGDISKINSNPAYVRTMEAKGREKAFNGILGTNLSAERREIYSILEKNSGNINKAGKFGLFLDPVSTLNVQGKGITGIDSLHTKINLLSINGNPILIPIEGDKKISLFNKVKNKLPQGTNINNVKFSLGKDAEGLDDQILVEGISSGVDTIRLNKVNVDEREKPDKPERNKEPNGGNRGGANSETTPGHIDKGRTYNGKTTEADKPVRTGTGSSKFNQQ